MHDDPVTAHRLPDEDIAVWLDHMGLERGPLFSWNVQRYAHSLTHEITTRLHEEGDHAFATRFSELRTRIAEAAIQLWLGKRPPEDPVGDVLAIAENLLNVPPGTRLAGITRGRTRIAAADRFREVDRPEEELPKLARGILKLISESQRRGVALELIALSDEIRPQSLRSTWMVLSILTDAVTFHGWLWRGPIRTTLLLTGAAVLAAIVAFGPSEHRDWIIDRLLRFFG